MRKARINLEVPENMRDKLLVKSLEKDPNGKRISLSEHVRRAITEYLKDGAQFG